VRPVEDVVVRGVEDVVVRRAVVVVVDGRVVVDAATNVVGGLVDVAEPEVVASVAAGSLDAESATVGGVSAETVVSPAMGTNGVPGSSSSYIFWPANHASSGSATTTSAAPMIPVMDLPYQLDRIHAQTGL